MQKVKSRLLQHDSIYDERYFSTVVEESATRSAGKMSESIASGLNPRTVLDVGCGTGALLDAMRARGCAVKGLEYAEAALAYCRKRGLDVSKFDIELDTIDLAATYDVVISVEVGEHLPERCAERYIDILTRAAPIVVFAAAHPGQGGTDHINEQPASYWRAKFRSRGYELQSAMSEEWRVDWAASGLVPRWYCDNLMIFLKSVSN